MSGLTNTAGNGNSGGIYIHVPFCRRKCSYCNFYSVSDMSLRPQYPEALVREMELAAGARTGLEYDTLYIGGGTPSVLNVDALASIIESAHRLFRILPSSEVTVEVNPGTVDLSALCRYHTSGVNRLNIGVQSFQEKNLKCLGRIHGADDSVNAIDWARSAGFENIGIDLIYGIPGQTRESWRQDLERALTWRPEHLSCYALTYEKGAPLKVDLDRGRIRPLSDGQVALLYLTTVELLQRSGYEQYEISNYSRGFALRSRHNCKYWNFAPYLGLGPSSHSFFSPVRSWNKADLRAYIKDLEGGRRPVGGQETLSRQQMMIESVYLGLRLTDGVNTAGFESRFGTAFATLFEKPLEVYTAMGLLENANGRCRLTPRGMLVIDSIASSFIDQI